MLPALPVRYAQQNLQAEPQEKTRSAHVVKLLRINVKEGSDDGRIKSAGPSRPAVGGRQRFSQAHGSASNGLNRALNRSIGRCWLAKREQRKGVANNSRGMPRKITPAETYRTLRGETGCK